MKILTTLVPGLLMSSMAAAGQLIAHTESLVPGRYMVVLDHPPGYAFESAGKEVSDFITRNKITVTDVWNDALNGFLITDVDEATAKSLSALPGVRFVEADSRGQSSSTQANPPRGLDQIDQRTTILDNIYQYNYTGSNVHVYVLDTGIRTTHTDFGGRATNDVDCVNYTPCTYNPSTTDTWNHGTPVASIIGGTKYGVAKGVHLHSVKVNNQEPIYASDIVKGLNWVKQNAIKPAVVNMSFQLYSRSTIVDDAAYGVASQGIFVAAAAGNSQGGYLDTCTISPAAAQGVFAVSADPGSSTIPGNGLKYGLGPCVSIFGPGGTNSIQAADGSIDTAETAIVYTSAATPHVAGVAALILQQYPNLTPDQVRWEIIARATPNIVAAPNLYGAPNLFVYSLPVYSTIPTPPSSLTVGAPNCTSGISHLAWSGGGVATYAEVQRSATSTFSSPGQAYIGPAHAFDVANVIPTTYYRVRNCNSLGCSAFTNGNAPAVMCH